MLEPEPTLAPDWRERPPPPVGVMTRLSRRLVAVVLGGFVLVYLKGVLVPMVLAVLLAFLLHPLVCKLVDRRVPKGLAIVIAEAIGTLPIIGVVFVFIATAGPLSARLPKYQARLTQQIGEGIQMVLARIPDPELQTRMLAEIQTSLLPEVLNQGVYFAQRSMAAATTAAGYFFLTLLLSAFILLEGTRFSEKFTEAFGAKHPVRGSLQGIGDDVRAYVVTKTVISALTGLCVWAFLAACDVDFAAFWGLLAFPLNFIPTVGAIAASLPPILIAIVDPELSTGMTAFVAIGLMTINGVIGSVLDPRFVGQAVRLSPLMVFLSMLVWAILWGPVGMILAVPIMVSVKVICARVPGLEPVAILMKG